jgi:molybdopterin molybdotransferase
MPQSLVDVTLVEPKAVWLWLDQHCKPLHGETIPLEGAVGRILSAPIVSSIDIPATPVAAVDGFALSSGDTVGASDYNPLPFRIGATSSSSPSAAFPVLCGASLPTSTDAVLPIDECQVHGAGLSVDRALASGENVRQSGQEARMGDMLLDAGHRLRPQCLALLAGAGIDRIDVVRQPCARLVCVRGSDQDSSSAMVATQLHRAGCRVNVIEYADDDPDVLAAKLDRRDGGTANELIITIGGTGPGANDYAVDVLGTVGEVAFHGVAIHPGERVAIGRMGQAIVVQLPGTPLACFMAADFFAARAARGLSGCDPDAAYASTTGVLASKIASRLGRLEICRVRIDGTLVTPLAVADGDTLATSVRADGFVVIPVRSEGYPSGAEVKVHLYDHPL